VDANDVQQIEDAVAWGEKNKSRIVIQRRRDSWRVTELLVKNTCP
jgi:hypothetical protein